MKTTASKLFSAFISLIITCSAFAQEKTTQSFWVHEDRVKPAMLMEYEQAAKQLVENCKKYDVKTLNWLTSQTDDFRYLYITPINSMADINFDGFKPLQENMGKEAFGQMFADMDKCYTAHGNYVLILDHDLSYMPDGMTQTPAGQDYRRFYFLYTTPGDLGPLTEAIKNVKKLYVEKGSKSHYRIYRSGFGNVGDYFMVAVAAKDAISYETQGETNDKLLGPDAKEVFGNVMKYVTKMEEVSGKMRSDLAYSPSE